MITFILPFSPRLISFSGSKAISSQEDDKIFEAIRELSILKENPNSKAEEIAMATKKVEKIQGELSELSEMAKIRNLHWWSVEYGLIVYLLDNRIDQ